MKITLAQAATVLALVGAVFAAGRAWESHDQRIKALEAKQSYMSGEWDLPKEGH